MATTYPAIRQVFTNPAGTNTLDSPDHASGHTTVYDTTIAVEDVLGTTAGTSVLKSFGAGDFPVIMSASGVLKQNITAGTFNNTVIGTPAITGGTLTNTTIGVLSGATLNNSTIGTPNSTGGTIKSAVLGTNSIIGGTMNGVVVGTPNITGGTYTSPTFITYDGWTESGETWTYASADSPVFTFTVPGTLTGKYSMGMRFKLTQATGGTKFFLIAGTPTVASGSTTLTIYGGTAYTLNNEAISSPYYSIAKLPAGFPANHTYWTYNFIDTSDRVQGTPTGATTYNLGTLIGTIPIGAWNVTTSFPATGVRAGNGPISCTAGIHTANNALDATYYGRTYVQNSTELSNTIVVKQLLVLGTKTPYYFNARTNVSDQGTLAFWGATSHALTLNAVSALL